MQHQNDISSLFMKMLG